MTRRVLIVGGVAGGASCAARLRRLDESAEIAIFDRGPHVSFANCGLPYFVGNVIADQRQLLVATSDLFRERFAIAVHTRHEVTAIDRAARTITVLDLANGRERREPYDALVLSPGAAPIRPAMPGIDLPGIFAVRTIPDSVGIRSWIEQRQPARALVVGGGFIGLEMAENLAHRGLAVTVLEKLPQVMPPLDPEMAEPVREHLAEQGVTVRLGDGLARFVPDGSGIVAITESGARLAGRPRDPGHRRAAGDRPRGGRRTAARPARRNPRGRPDADRRSGHLGGGRCGGGARRRHGPGSDRAAGRPREPSGPRRRGVDLRATPRVPGCAGHGGGGRLWIDRRLHRRQREGTAACGRRPPSSGSTCIPAITPATIPARARSI